MAEYKVTTSDHEERCLNFNIVGIQTWINNAVAAQVIISEQEIIKKNMDHCNANGIAIATGVEAQVKQAYDLGVVTTGDSRNNNSGEPGGS